MEESDNMLIATLKEHIEVPARVSTLTDIRAEQLFSISIKTLEYFKADTTPIISLANKQQRFRSMTKMNQALQGTLETQLQMNDLMNPSVPFLRKFILMLINKFGYSEHTEKSKVQQTTQVNTKYQAKQEKIKLRQWINEEWIHPSLASKKHKYKGYILPMIINKAMLKNSINLTNQLNNPLLGCNTQSTLTSTEAKLKQRVKQFQANQGFARKEYEQQQIRLQNIIKLNKDDWLINYNKLQKIKKKIIEIKQENVSEIQPPEAPSVFKQELQEAELEAEKKKQQDNLKPKQETRSESTQEQLSLNPFQILKKEAEHKKHQYQNQIREIIEELQKRKEAIQGWQKQKQGFDELMISDEQKIAKLKQQTIDLKKQVEKRQNILATLEGEKNIDEEINKLEEQIQLIEQHANEEVKKMETEIKQVQLDSTKKMQALKDLKAKLTKIQTQYEKICEEITEKEQLKGNVKILKSAISRNYYHKKISDMESRWREQEKQTKKLKASLVELREKTAISSTLNVRVETEISNIINSDKSKFEPENKALKELINQCKSAFQNTLKTLEEANEVKMQTQDYEVKVHTLSGKNFKQNIQKIEMAMQDLKRQMTELTKSKLK